MSGWREPVRDRGRQEGQTTGEGRVKLAANFMGCSDKTGLLVLRKGALCSRKTRDVIVDD